MIRHDPFILVPLGRQKIPLMKWLRNWWESIIDGVKDVPDRYETVYSRQPWDPNRDIGTGVVWVADPHPYRYAFPPEVAGAGSSTSLLRAGCTPNPGS